MPQIPLTINDIIFAVVGAAILFAIYRIVSAMIRMFVTRTTIIRFHPNQLDNILQNCYHNFPIDYISFKGATFLRGATVRITTSRHAVIEGKLIGTNDAKMVCLMTGNSIIAQEIDAILEIQAL